MASLWDDLESLVLDPVVSADTTEDRGTIKPKVAFNAEEDAESLRNALEGLGTKEQVLLEVLTQRSGAQRQLVCQRYQEATGRTLEEDLKGDTGGDFEDLLVALVTPPAAFDCHEVTRAMKGAGTRDDVLIEVFSSRSNQQIQALCAVYLEETEKKLSLDLQGEVSGAFGEALLLLADGQREESSDVDEARAKEDAQILFDAGEKKWGTDESKFVEILCRRSVPQLRRTFVEYKKISGKTLVESIASEMSGKLEELLLAVVKCVHSVPAFLAERLHRSTKGWGTDERTLTRVLVSRSELDLLDVAAEFQTLCGSSLLAALESELSGYHRDCMKAICGGHD